MERHEVIETVDNISGIAVTPQQNRRRTQRRNKPSKEFGFICSVEGDVLERQPGDARPIPVDPRSWMIDEQLIEEVGRGDSDPLGPKEKDTATAF
jgi:hypothetical protein